MPSLVVGNRGNFELMSDCVSRDSDTKSLTNSRYLLFPSTRDGTSISTILSSVGGQEKPLSHTSLMLLSLCPH